MQGNSTNGGSAVNTSHLNGERWVSWPKLSMW